MPQAIRALKKKDGKRPYVKKDHEFWARGIKRKAARVVASKRGKAMQLFVPPISIPEIPKIVVPRTTRRIEVTVHLVEYTEG